MARLAALVSQLASLTLRDAGRRLSPSGNHFLVAAALLSALSPRSAPFLLGGVGLVLLFPLGADPLHRIPAERLSLFPISSMERLGLRVFGLLLNPVLWGLLALVVWRGKYAIPASAGLLVASCAGHGVAGMVSRRRGPASHSGRIPLFLSPMGGLVAKNLREMMHLLDPYVALLLSGAALAFRVTSHAPVSETSFGMTQLVALALSTCAQRLFAFDGGRGFERYRMMPLRGCQVLLAKGAAFLVVLMLLTLPLAPVTGLAMGLVMLAIGHRASIRVPYRQAPWSFTAGVPGFSGLAQVAAALTAGTMVHRVSAWGLVPCAILYAGSLFHYGLALERQ